MNPIKKALFLIEHNQDKPERIEPLISILKFLKVSLHVDLLISVQSSMVMPGIPVGLVAVYDEQITTKFYQTGKDIIELIKEKCQESGLRCDGNVSLGSLLQYSSEMLEDYGLILVSDKIERLSLIDEISGSVYGKISKKHDTPVWILKSLSFKFNSINYFSISRPKNAMKLEFLDRLKAALKIPLKCDWLDCNTIEIILQKEIENSRNFLKEPSLLIFDTNLCKGFPLFNKKYRAIEKLVNNSQHHIIFLP